MTTQPDAMAAHRDPDRAGRLLELAVADLALIDRLRLVLGPGLSVLTGETGAGKSLLIDALGLALGARADTALVRHGADGARVEALFDRAAEPLIAVREVAASGRSTARLDDETVTAGRLASTVGSADRDPRAARPAAAVGRGAGSAICWTYSGVTRRRGRRWQSRWSAGARTVRPWRRSRSLRASSIRRLEMLEHEATEIAGASLRAGEAAEITRSLAAAQHAETIASGAAAAREVLIGEGRGARERVGEAAQEMRALARLDERWGPLADRLAGLEAELEDVASEMRTLAETVDHDPASLVRLESRLGEIHRLLRRYGDDEAEVIAHGERAVEEAERLRGLDEERAARAAEDARLLAAVGEVAATLSIRRTETAVELGRSVAAVLVELGFPADAFQIAVGRRPAARDDPAVEVDGDAVAFDATGIDAVVFTFRPNPGEPARPLARIASGGELSRVALAVKQVLAGADATPTLVFDEIDSGIGGRSADPVGRSLWTLARDHQVLCVTHLPQIAAYADAHYRIAKLERGGRTVTEVVELDRAKREVELAEMIGGAVGGVAATQSARELLDRAEAWRGTRLADAGA